MDVTTWLRNLGFEEYEAAFRQNAVDLDILPRLTADDLKDLGVVTVGHRRKLLDAISDLRSAAGSSTRHATSAPPSPSPAPYKAALEIAAERRPIAVMFCDLVGSTKLSRRSSTRKTGATSSAPTSTRPRPQSRMFGGHVLKKLGDGLMALFGYPQAQENDAERAVRAGARDPARARRAQRAERSAGCRSLSARIGLESARSSSTRRAKCSAKRRTSPRVCRAVAEPGLLVTADVQRQIAGLFVAEDKGAHELKGVPAQLTLYRIVRASGGGRRSAHAPTPLVGREEDLSLIEGWTRVRRRRTVLLVVGEPGIGKSRVVDEFRPARDTPHTWIEWRASQLLQNTPLHPVVEWARLRFGADVDAEKRLADPREHLAAVGLDPVEVYVAACATHRYSVALAPPKLAPEELRRRQLAAMTTGFWRAHGLSRSYWRSRTCTGPIRPPSISCARWSNAADRRRCSSSRPRDRNSARRGECARIIASSRSPRSTASRSARMVGEIAARHALPDDVIDRVGERTGGVPLFVEEVTRLLLERGAEAACRRSRRPCSNRSRRGLTGSATRARSRRSERFSAAIFPMRLLERRRRAG